MDDEELYKKLQEAETRDILEEDISMARYTIMIFLRLLQNELASHEDEGRQALATAAETFFNYVSYLPAENIEPIVEQTLKAVEFDRAMTEGTHNKVKRLN